MDPNDPTVLGLLYGSFDSDSFQELIIAGRSTRDARYAIAAMLALQLYELIACMTKEVRVIHRAPWTNIKTLYLCCRYYPLALWLLLIWAYVGDHDAALCSRIVHPVHALLAPCQFFSQAVMLMRAYAFAGRRTSILLLLGSCYLGLLGVDIWAFCTAIDVLPTALYTVTSIIYHTKGTGCFPNYGAGFMALRIGYSMLAAVLMDSLSLAVVVVHCIRTGWNRDVSLARYFVNQGLTAFLAVTFVNVATAISFFSPPRYQTGIGLPLILTVSNIFACRLILQLRSRLMPTAWEIKQQHSRIIREGLQDRFPSDEDNWLMTSSRTHQLPT